MATKMTSILVVEDDPEIRRVLKLDLKSRDYHYMEAVNGKDGLQEAMTRAPDLVILDLGLPDMDGLDFIRKLRAKSAVPVIVLTARHQERDKVIALDQGADDYLTKPFGVDELLARIRVALRHAHKIAAGGGDSIFQNGDLKIDFGTRRVYSGEKEVRLTPTEYRILTLLARHAGLVLTQKQLLSEIWGPAAEAQSNYLHVHMHQLRHKLEANPARPRWLVNEPGVGYRMKVED